MTPACKYLLRVAQPMTLGAMLASCWVAQDPATPRTRHPVAVFQSKRMAAPPVELAHLAAPAQAAPLAPPAAMPEAPPAVDPFAATTWFSPPAPTPAVVPAVAAAPAAPTAPPTAPPVPVAPPNPFVYAGSYKDGPQEMVILLKGDQVLLVQQGETIDNAYRLDRIGPAGLVMTYLPMQLRQSIPISDPI
jgi:hypothetical protein